MSESIVCLWRFKRILCQICTKVVKHLMMSEQYSYNFTVSFKSFKKVFIPDSINFNSQTVLCLSTLLYICNFNFKLCQTSETLVSNVWHTIVCTYAGYRNRSRILQRVWRLFWLSWFILIRGLLDVLLHIFQFLWCLGGSGCGCSHCSAINNSATGKWWRFLWFPSVYPGKCLEHLKIS